MRIFGRLAFGAALLAGVGTATLPQQRIDPGPLEYLTPCGVGYEDAVVHGHQLVRVPRNEIGAVTCNDTSVLPPVFRAKVRCTLEKLDKGGWHAKVFETYRSDARQQFLWSYSRTRPGPRVTNASSAVTSAHGYFLAVDIIDRYKGWDNPRFFKWVAIHAESCGLTSGAYWVKFPDAPHVQTGVWAGSPPKWAQALAQQDSVRTVLERLHQF